tara:strand:+ start:485 stop:685 length:201 start_codon:yes stop_codon:yes gene_type:complete
MMTTKVVWVLLLVTAYSDKDFAFERIGAYDTIAECYVASTQEFWDEMPINKEALCIRVEELTNEKN